jgi:hypothetical protein
MVTWMKKLAVEGMAVPMRFSSSWGWLRKVPSWEGDTQGFVHTAEQGV